MITEPDPRQGGRARVVLLAGFALFLVVLAYLVASSLTRRTAPAFEPSPLGRPLRDTAAAGPDSLTLDARHETEWRYADLDLGIALPPGDSTGWDLAARRFHLRSVSPVRSVSAAMPPAPTGDFGRWYSYGALSHLLQTSGDSYHTATDRGRPVRIEILSYYCPGLHAGCLTVRYRMVPHPASSR